MKARQSGTIAALTLILGLAACSDDPEDRSVPPEIETWIEQQHQSIDHDDLLGASSSVALVPEEDDADAEHDNFVRMSWGNPATVTGLEFSCFGDGAMAPRVTTRIDGVETSIESAELECAASPHDVQLGVIEDASVYWIEVRGYGHNGDSAVHAVVLGEDQGR